jgi:hypothetical protein
VRRRQQLRLEVGQVLVVVALALPMFFSVCAFVVDGSNLMVHRRSIQNAADAAALAAAQELPIDGSVCSGPCQASVQARAEEYSIKNYTSKNGDTATLHKCHEIPGPPPKLTDRDDTNCFATPYVDQNGSHPQLVYVRLEDADVPEFFTNVIGIAGPFKVSARASASRNGVTQVNVNPGTPDSTSTSTIPGTPAQTIGGEKAVAFAYSSDCGEGTGGNPFAAITWGGGATSLTALATNGGIWVTGTPGKHANHLALGKKGVHSPVECEDDGTPAGMDATNFPDVTLLVGKISSVDGKCRIGGTGAQCSPIEYPVTPPNPAPPAGCKSFNPTSSVISKQLAAKVVTLTTASAHGLAVGDTVVVSGVGSPFDGANITVSTVPSTTTFKYSLTGNPSNVPPTPVNPPGTVTKKITSVTINNGWTTASGGSNPPGVYCIEGSQTSTTPLIFSANGGTFNGYTFYAPTIQVTSGNMTLIPPSPPAGQRPVVLEAYGNDPDPSQCHLVGNTTACAFIMSGNGNTIQGDIYAPNGTIWMNGGSASTGGSEGFMEAVKLIVSGNLATFLGSGPLVGATTIPGTPDSYSTTTILGTPPSTITVTTGTTIALDE